MALVIRPVSREDVDELAALSEAAFRRTYEGILEASTIDAVVTQACTSPSFLSLLERYTTAGGLSRLLLATDGAVLLGFLDFAEEDDGLELRRLYTRVGGTSRGVGAALLAALETDLPPGTQYRIVVVAENLKGLRFWQRHGFGVRGEIDGIDHFRAHRGVTFDRAAAAAKLLVLDRTTGVT